MTKRNPETHTKLHIALSDASAYLESRLGARRPAVGLVLGSGLGAFVDQFEDVIAIGYHEIPHFVPSTVAGHMGRFVIGTIAGVTCMAMQGRLHYYEGYSAAEVAFPTRVMIELGADTLILTNAAGSLETSWTPGTLMLISDHINLTGANPLVGPNDHHIGPRFPDMTEAYSNKLRQLARQVAGDMGLDLREGVYAGLAGPTYETPAEIRMVRAIGGNAVGMSTVFEAIAAQHMGARVLGISCITNLAAGLQGQPLHHDEVTVAAESARESFQGLLTGVIRELGRELAIGEDDDDSADAAKSKDADAQEEPA
jgi:purine-nucleoside phosphorylase